MQSREVLAGVAVECTDGPCGRAKYVILDPDAAVVTHVVVGEPDALAETRLVPLSDIVEGTRDLIRLKYTKRELRLLPLFSQYGYAKRDEFYTAHMGSELWMGSLMPYLPIISPEEHGYAPQVEVNRMSTMDSRKTQNSIEDLVADLASSSRPRREAARSSLVRIGPPAVDALTSALAHNESWARWEAAKTLQQIASPSIAPAMMSILEDRNPGLRWIAAEGLAELGRDGVIPLLKALTTKPDSVWLRRGAHHVFRLLTDADLSKAVAPVLAALDDVVPVLSAPIAAHRALIALE